MSLEFQQQPEDQGIIEMLALFLTGKVKKEDLDENNQVTLGYYLGLMSEDRNFASKVQNRKNQMSTQGTKTTLFSREQLQKAKRHRKKNKVSEPMYQPMLWEESRSSKPGFLEENNPEREISKMHDFANDRQNIHYKKIIREDVSRNKNMLREVIGLPVVRGKNPNVNDQVYKFLVRRVAQFDTFGIFNEYDRNMGFISGDLEVKVSQVKGMVDEVVNGHLTVSERFEKFHQFVEDYKSQWGIESEIHTFDRIK